MVLKKTKLNFRFHNPNTEEDTRRYIIKLFLESGQNKLDEVLKQESAYHLEDDKICSL